LPITLGAWRKSSDFRRTGSLASPFRIAAIALVVLMSNRSSARAQEFAAFPVRGHGLRSTQFRAGEYSCTVAVVGNGTCTSAAGPAWKFKLPAESRDAVFEVVYAMVYDDGILLLLEFEDSDSGWSRIIRLQRGASRPVWIHELQCFNLVPPLRRGRDLFLAGLAFSARLDARTGRFVWRHIGRYKTGDMDGPERLEIDQDRVVVRGTAGGKPTSDCFAAATGTVIACL
jgi:hypothetical protein